MIWHKGQQRATPDEREHLAAVKALPCICCLQEQVQQPCPTEVHHIVSGNRRVGHTAVVPVCSWHHRGLPPGEITASQAEYLYGPSLARQPKVFRATYGTDQELLDRTNALLERGRGA